jgi:hypothetical protein
MADFFEACPEIGRIDVLKVSSQDEVIAAFFQRALSYVQEPDFILGAAFLVSFGDIGGDRGCRASHLGRQPKQLALWESLCMFINVEDELMGFPPRSSNVRVFICESKTENLNVVYVKNQLPQNS